MSNRVDECADPTRRNVLAIAAMAPALAATGRAGAAVAASAAESAPSGSAELPPDLARAVDDYDHATTRNDVATLGRLVADDYVLVNSDSTLQDKASYLADFNVPGFRLDPYVIREPVLKVWKEAAVTGGLLPLSWTQDGKRHQRLLRVAHVWSRQGGRWRITYTQLTRVPQ